MACVIMDCKHDIACDGFVVLPEFCYRIFCSEVKCILLHLYICINMNEDISCSLDSSILNSTTDGKNTHNMDVCYCEAPQYPFFFPPHSCQSLKDLTSLFRLVA